MNRVTAILSMLHEPPAASVAEPAQRLSSAARRFRAEPVLAWTLHRLGRCRGVKQSIVLCWDDQAPAVERIATEFNAAVSVRSPRVAVPCIDAVAAARRWSDGWRGGLLATCDFDRGFHAQWIFDALRKCDGDMAMLVDPAAAMIDAALLDGLIEHARQYPGVEMYFSQAAPGLSAVLLRPELLEQLIAARTHPGSLLCYRPDVPRRDPIATEACAPVPTRLARAACRFTLDSHRQVEWMQSATEQFNGQLISTEAERLLDAMESAPPQFCLPREITLELVARRNTRPIYQPASHLKIDRPDLSLENARILFEQLDGADDIRLMLAGAGDPLLHPRCLDIIDLARQRGIHAVGIETDLLGIDDALIDRLAESSLDVIGIHLGGASTGSYQAVMGVDGLAAALGNLRRLADRRTALGRGTPLLCPLLYKCAANLAEMESWYDHWLRVLGSAVIIGPGDYAAQIPATAVADMTPPARRPCWRIASRLTILSSGDVVCCEQDVLGRHPLGNIAGHNLRDIWAGAMADLRGLHQGGKWDQHPLCAACKDGHRP